MRNGPATGYAAGNCQSTRRPNGVPRADTVTIAGTCNGPALARLRSVVAWAALLRMAAETHVVGRKVMARFRTFLQSAFVLALAVAVVYVVAADVSSEQLPPGHETLSITTAQGDRECVIYAPRAYDKTSPIPVVIMLHGMGGTAINALRETGWSAKADDEAFIAVYPEATRPAMDRPPSFSRNPQAWNDGSGRFHAADKQIDDVAFIRAVIDRITAEYAVDDHRIFVTGFSNGASMAFRVAAELSDRIAAVAPNAGACWTESPHPTRMISICYITGAADTLNPLEGGFPRLAFGGKQQGGRPKPAVQAVIDKWAKALECPPEPSRDETIKGVRTRVYGPGRDSAEVAFVTVEGLGHHWAGGEAQAPEFLVGRRTDKLKATDVVWDFFQSHPVRKASIAETKAAPGDGSHSR